MIDDETMVLLKSDMIFIVRSSINLIVDASSSAYLGHTTVVCQSLGLIRDLTALERNVFDLEGITHQQAVSTFCLFPQMSLSVHLNLSPRRSQASQRRHLPPLLPLPSLRRSAAFSLSFASFRLNQTCTLFYPYCSLPQPEPGKASWSGAQMVFWRGSQFWVPEPAGCQHGPSVPDMAKANPGTCL